MEITGHSRGEVFDRYNQVNENYMRQAFERLVDYRRGQAENVDQSVVTTVVTKVLTKREI